MVCPGILAWRYSHTLVILRIDIENESKYREASVIEYNTMTMTTCHVWQAAVLHGMACRLMDIQGISLATVDSLLSHYPDGYVMSIITLRLFTFRL